MGWVIGGLRGMGGGVVFVFWDGEGIEVEVGIVFLNGI